MKNTIFEVDLDSLESINKTLNLLKNYRGNLSKPDGMLSKKESGRQTMAICKEVWNTDISKLYSLNLDPTPIYYVYAHCYPDRKIAIGKNGRTTFLATLGIKNIPFYIGKGSGERYLNLDRNGTHRKIRQGFKTFNKEIISHKIIDRLTELEAFCYEAKLIDICGVQGKGGFLVNLDEGSDSKTRQNLYPDDCFFKLCRFNGQAKERKLTT